MKSVTLTLRLNKRVKTWQNAETGSVFYDNVDSFMGWLHGRDCPLLAQPLFTITITDAPTPESKFKLHTRHPVHLPKTAMRTFTIKTADTEEDVPYPVSICRQFLKRNELLDLADLWASYTVGVEDETVPEQYAL